MTQKSARYWKGVVVALFLPVFVSLPLSWLIFMINNLDKYFATMIYGWVVFMIDYELWALYSWLRDKSKAA